jgi:hypothetical protein
MTKAQQELTEEMVHAVNRVAHAITADAAGGRDENGGYVSSLTEAVMGMTAGLLKIAEAINSSSESSNNRVSYLDDKEQQRLNIALPLFRDMMSDKNREYSCEQCAIHAVEAADTLLCALWAVPVSVFGDNLAKMVEARNKREKEAK